MYEVMILLCPVSGSPGSGGAVRAGGAGQIMVQGSAGQLQRAVSAAGGQLVMTSSGQLRQAGAAGVMVVTTGEQS